jgi:hypothetical protein
VLETAEQQQLSASILKLSRVFKHRFQDVKMQTEAHGKAFNRIREKLQEAGFSNRAKAIQVEQFL